MSANTPRAERRRGLLEEAERDPTQRVIIRPKERRPWTQGQEICLTLAVIHCQSTAAYDQTCMRILDIVRHPTSYDKDARPSILVHHDNCMRAVELRLITKCLLREYKEWKVWNLPALRRRRPLTWGERVKILQPWLRRVDGDRISREELFQVMFRDAGLDRVAVNAYSETFLSKRKFREVEDRSAGCPVTVRNMGPLQTAVQGYDNISEDMRPAHKIELVEEMIELMTKEVKRGWSA
jgi:hypothetical protein